MKKRWDLCEVWLTNSHTFLSSLLTLLLSINQYWLKLAQILCEFVIHCTVYKVHWTLHCSLLYFLHFTSYTVHSIFYIVHCTFYILHCTLYILHFTFYTVHSTFYILYTLHFTLFILHCTFYATLYTVHSTFYIVHCTVYILLFTFYTMCVLIVGLTLNRFNPCMDVLKMCLVDLCSSYVWGRVVCMCFQCVCLFTRVI